MKRFNITGPCIPELHYMADITDKLNAVRKMIDYGDYFTINRARQYGKTTMLQAIERTCSITYLVLRISFEGLGESVFSSEHRFIDSFTKLIFKELEYHNAAQYLLDIWNTDLIKSDFHELGNKITSLNKSSDKKILLLIDEVDKYSDNQVFLDFLGLLRTLYLDRMKRVTFHSIILTGVYDIKNLKLKRSDGENKRKNSPWNIAVTFNIDLSLDVEEIMSMIHEYQLDHNIQIPVFEISQTIYHYTSGYPYLVSLLCYEIVNNERIEWTGAGVQKALKIVI